MNIIIDDILTLKQNKELKMYAGINNAKSNHDRAYENRKKNFEAKQIVNDADYSPQAIHAYKTYMFYNKTLLMLGLA